MGISLRAPVIDFCHIVRMNGGVDARCIHHLAPWFVKLILLEPLRLLEHLLYDNKIRKHPLPEDPVIILGFYRSGTTLLQRLFALHPGFGYQTIFHSAFPEIMLSSEHILKPLLNAFSKIFRVRNAMHGIPFEWDFPGEEDVAMTSLAVAESVNWGNLFPRSFDRYWEEYAWFKGDSESARLWQEQYLYWLKKLSLKHKGKQLVLKSPPNTARLKLLYDTFPKARIVCIFRDPYQVFGSSRRFWKIINRHYALQQATDDEIDRIVLRSYNETLNCYHNAKASLPGLTVYELTYERLMEEPIVQFKMICKKLGIEDSELISSCLTHFMDSNRDYQPGKYELTKTEKEMIKQNWHRHISYWEKLRGIGS